jgi:hypothetical protein
MRRILSTRWPLLAVLAMSTASGLQAQGVAVSPMGLYIDSRTRVGALTIYNPGTLPAEVDIGFAFGYPRSDDNGAISVELTSEPEADEPSALGWLRVFPRRMVLQPGQRQVVRVLVEPPAGLSDGEYWARVVVSSRESQPAIADESNGTRFQVGIRTNLVLPVNYRNGVVSTGVEVSHGSGTHSCDRVTLDLGLRRTGTAAFLGRLRAELVDGNGRRLSQTVEDVAVYHALRRRLHLTLPPGAGPYEARVAIGTDRDDLPAGATLPAASTVVRIPVVAAACDPTDMTGAAASLAEPYPIFVPR